MGKISESRAIRIVKKLSLLLVILFIAVFLSCEKNPVEEYGDAVVNTYQGTKQKGKHLTLTGLQNAIQLYRTANGRYPKDIEEVAGLMDSPIDFSLYDYNPQTGQISMKE
jgi:hypothetical protein